VKDKNGSRQIQEPVKKFKKLSDTRGQSMLLSIWEKQVVRVWVIV